MPEKSIAELEEIVGESRVTVEELTVEAGKVAEFATALGDDDTVYRDIDEATDRGFASIPAPLTFTEVRRHSHNRPADFVTDGIQGFDLGFDEERTVHGEQAYEYERQPEVGETLTGTTTLTDVSQRKGNSGIMTFVDLTTEYRNSDGELVLTEQLTAIET
jgi:hydroxyacyl-ACP dehydratase HTD2-like protein with hotdog domain